MTTSSSGSGGEFLAKKSDVTRLRKALPELRDVLIVEDETMDSDRLKATLRVMFGYELQSRVAPTLARALDCIIERKPEIVFLDDVLKPSDNASQTIPYLRRADYTGPIVVVSGQVTRNRRNQLLAAGATDVIHKDDVDSVRLAEALLRVFTGSGKPGALAAETAKTAAPRKKR
jgi:DNA-binding NarL/FixJ family response regulator